MRKLVTILFMLWAVPSILNAQKRDSVASNNDWQLRIGPYYWFIGIEASLERPPVPSTLPEIQPQFDISIPYNEVKNSLKFAFLINTDFNKNRWLGVLNATSFILEGDAITPNEIILRNSNYRLAMAFGEALAGYEVVSKPKFRVQGFLGTKVIFNKIGVRATYGLKQQFERERQGLWIEPVIGMRIKYLPHSRIECSAYADYGPFRSKNELTNQFTLNVNVLLNKWLYVAPGYRYWMFRVNKDQAIFNGQMYGFFVRIGGQF